MSEPHGHHYPLEQIHAIIAARGWHDIHEQPPEPLCATTIYTVGFALIGRPEIVCVGMPHNLVTQFVGQIYHRLGHHDEYTVGVVYHDLANLPMTFGAVSDRLLSAISQREAIRRDPAHLERQARPLPNGSTF